MEPEALAVKLAEVDSRSRSNTKRIDKLEQSTDALTRIATSVEVMATKLQQMSDTVDRLDDKVSDLESEPGKRWKGIVEKTIWAVVGGVVVFLLARIGIA